MSILHSTYAAPLSPSSAGISGQNLGNTYDALLDGLYASGNATTTVNNNLWVPWYATSTSCTVADLHSGASCNSGETIDATHNCMVTDEFSQVGILVAMGQNPTRMSQYFGTINAIASTHDQLPGWRVYRSGNTINACKAGINGNCDTASDADARIIISLYTASRNSAFSSAERALYAQLANNLSVAFLKNEVVKECHPSNLGYGDICYWLAAGSGAKSGGLGASDFGYTGYYPDAIIAMLAACGQTGNTTYCAAAGNFTLNYLQASKWDGSQFTAPPGRSFKWTNTGAGQVPTASCTNTCNPDQWDYADASRATGLCSANYYAGLVGTTLPGLQSYCAQWTSRHLSNPTSIPLQYFPDGTNSASYQSGFFAQGLEALHEIGANQASLQTTITSALGHYNTNTRTWDNTACFGVYTEAFIMRAIGTSIGRDQAGFPAAPIATPTIPPTTPPSTTNSTGTPTITNTSTNTTQNITSMNTTTNTTNTTTNATNNTQINTPASTNTTNNSSNNQSTLNTVTPLPSAGSTITPSNNPPATPTSSNDVQETNTTPIAPPASPPEQTTNMPQSTPPAQPERTASVTAPQTSPPPQEKASPQTPPVKVSATPPAAETSTSRVTPTGAVTMNTATQHLSPLQAVLLMIGLVMFVSIGLVYVIENSPRYTRKTKRFGERTARFIKTILPSTLLPAPILKPQSTTNISQKDASELLAAAAAIHERTSPTAQWALPSQVQSQAEAVQNVLTESRASPLTAQEPTVWELPIFAEQ